MREITRLSPMHWAPWANAAASMGGRRLSGQIKSYQSELDASSRSTQQMCFCLQQLNALSLSLYFYISLIICTAIYYYIISNITYYISCVIFMHPLCMPGAWCVRGGTGHRHHSQHVSAFFPFPRRFCASSTHDQLLLLDEVLWGSRWVDPVCSLLLLLVLRTEVLYRGLWKENGDEETEMQKQQKSLRCRALYNNLDRFIASTDYNTHCSICFIHSWPPLSSGRIGFKSTLLLE